MLVRNLGDLKEFSAHGGTCRIREFFCEEFQSDVGFFNETYVAPGEAVEPHTHGDSEELYYILEGKGVITVNEEKREVGPGDAILTLSGSTHSIENTGDGDLRIIVFAAEVKKGG